VGVKEDEKGLDGGKPIEGNEGGMRRKKTAGSKKHSLKVMLKR